MYGAPTVGACYALTATDIDQTVDERNRFSHGRRVSCSTAHTSVTAGVVLLPHGLLWSGSAKEAYLAATSECAHASGRVIGTDRAPVAESAFRTVHFRPTEAAQEHGARWVRCDVVAFDFAGKSLLELPHVLKPFLEQRLPARYHLCLAGTPSTLRFVNCDQPHRYRIEHARLFPRLAWPGYQRVAAIAAHECAVVDDRPGTVWFRSARNAWDSGTRVVWCGHLDAS